MRKILWACAAYYNGSRCLLSLDRNAPEPRGQSGRGAVRAFQHVGGLHHRYSRAA
ncbi:MAG TPA: hypothetical protein VFY93_02070 [Planctomycetota bacterium]|nr:hypothetical protein [Planctomycetota bacterium]